MHRDIKKHVAQLIVIYERSEETSLIRRSKFAELSNVSSLTSPSYTKNDSS